MVGINGCCSPYMAGMKSLRKYCVVVDALLPNMAFERDADVAPIK